MTGYRVEQDDLGCHACGQGASFTVVDPTGTASGTSWMDKGAAEDQCDDLNRAYTLGVQSGFVPLRATYEHYRYLTEELSDLDKLIDYAEHNEDTALIVLYDCWRAIKAACEEGAER